VTAGPRSMAAVIAELMARRGLARPHSAAELEAAWREAAGPHFAEYTRVGSLRNGKLEVFVAHSAVLQELSYQKASLVSALANLLPNQQIKDLRFRLGAIAQDG